MVAPPKARPETNARRQNERFPSLLLTQSLYFLGHFPFIPLPTFEGATLDNPLEDIT
jgi:hypothetical protein